MRSQHCQRSHVARRQRAFTPARQAAFTLVEILVAMVVTLIMLGIVVTIFGLIGQNVSGSRATMEMTDRLRAAKHRLQLDLAGITVTMLPPRRPENDEGYFEYIEGPVGRMSAFTKQVPQGPDELNVLGVDTTVGDNDDILLFTTQSAGEPFVGRHVNGVLQSQTLQSQIAEVAWFIRGTTLYRRQMLVKPELNRVITGFPLQVPQPTQIYASGQSFASLSDLSVHAEGKGAAGWANIGPLDATAFPLRIVANSLSDLTKRENRFAHVPLMGEEGSPFGWPFDARLYGYSGLAGDLSKPVPGRLGLPTLRECSSPFWPLPIGIADGGAGKAGSRKFPVPQLTNRSLNSTEDFDAWDDPNPWAQQSSALDDTIAAFGGMTPSTRLGEDVILTNVLSFDVRIWDPTAIIVVDPSATPAAYLSPGDPAPGYGLAPPSTGNSYARAMIEYGKGTLGYGPVARGAYVDLNYAYNILVDGGADPTKVNSYFSGQGNSTALNGIKMNGNTVPPSLVPAIYDTWSTHYERDGIDQNDNNMADEGANGLDDNSNGMIDEDAEQEAPPPYRAPLRGLQVKIRCFDPDSKQIREVTIIQEFMPE